MVMKSFLTGNPLGILKRKHLVLILIMLGTLASFVTGYWAKSKLVQGGQAYVYGYPLILMDKTKRVMLPDTTRINHFTHSSVFPDHEFRNVVRPNNDTLYSIAWLDLEQEPVVLSVPNTDGRYYVMPLMDASTNVFATIGKRTTGTQAGKYLLSGPNWSRHVPSDLIHVRSPTNSVWVIGRIQTNTLSDVTAVQALQKQFGLATLSDYFKGKTNMAYSLVDVKGGSGLDPSSEIDDLSVIEFFTQLGELISVTQLPNKDDVALNNLSILGVNQRTGFDQSSINRIELWLLEKAFAIAKQRLADKINNSEPTENGWVVLRQGLGNYGADYGLRAAVAKVGLGALPPEEAAYPNAKVDGGHQPLNGRNSYVLHFAANELPPVNAFWSLAMYDKNGFFIENKIGRYSIGSRDELKLNTDGSLTIVIQRDKPVSGAANWLPCPDSEFAVTLRLYLPRKEFLDGSWVLPAIERVPI